jgi:hypothetical protein
MKYEYWAVHVPQRKYKSDGIMEEFQTEQHSSLLECKQCFIIYWVPYTESKVAYVSINVQKKHVQIHAYNTTVTILCMYLTITEWYR